jgi:hypothetical protein
MTEEQLRALIRDEVARQLATDAGAATNVDAGFSRHIPASPGLVLNDPSHARFTLPAAEGGLCIIEPRVMCTHCGYCKSYGH